MATSWYRTGTVTVTNGSTVVVGSGVNFTANLLGGEIFISADGKVYEIVNVASETVISIYPAYSGITASNQVYMVAPTQAWARVLAARLNEYSEANLQALIDELNALVPDVEALVNSLQGILDSAEQVALDKADVAAMHDEIVNNQAQINALLGLGVGSVSINSNGELLITVADENVATLSIDSNSFLILTY